MVRTTRAQRVALKRVFDRGPVYVTMFNDGSGEKPMTYRQFRKTVQCGSGCLMVRWQGMWLGIEPDGYTHS